MSTQGLRFRCPVCAMTACVASRCMRIAYMSNRSAVVYERAAPAKSRDGRNGAYKESKSLRAKRYGLYGKCHRGQVGQPLQVKRLAKLLMMEGGILWRIQTV